MSSPRAAAAEETKSPASAHANQTRSSPERGGLSGAKTGDPRREGPSPDEVRAEWDRQLIEEKGQLWFDTNRRMLDSQWEYAKTLL